MVWLEGAMKAKKSLKNPVFTLSTVNLLAKFHKQKGNFTMAFNVLKDGLEAVDNHMINEDTMNVISQMSSLISKLSIVSLKTSKLEDFLTTYNQQYLALKNQKLTLQKSSFHQQLNAIASVHELKKLPDFRKKKLLVM